MTVILKPRDAISNRLNVRGLKDPSLFGSALQFMEDRGKLTVRTPVHV
jgi:hypothetical protein